MLLLQALVLVSNSFWWLLTFLDLWPHGFLFYVYQISLCSLLRTLVIGLRAYLDNQK